MASLSRVKMKKYIPILSITNIFVTTVRLRDNAKSELLWTNLFIRTFFFHSWPLGKPRSLWNRRDIKFRVAKSNSASCHRHWIQSEVPTHFTTTCLIRDPLLFFLTTVLIRDHKHAVKIIVRCLHPLCYGLRARPQPTSTLARKGWKSSQQAGAGNRWWHPQVSKVSLLLA